MFRNAKCIKCGAGPDDLQVSKAVKVVVMLDANGRIEELLTDTQLVLERFKEGGAYTFECTMCDTVWTVYKSLSDAHKTIDIMAALQAYMAVPETKE